MDEGIEEWIEAETSRPVPPAVHAIAKAAIERYPHGAIDAVLFYGSCYRDGQVGDGLIDLYLLAASTQDIYPNRWMRFWATAIPPNVYYIETDFEDRTLRAKYALLTTSQFEQRVQAGVRNPYFWARFAQPTGIVIATDRPRIIKALANAIASLTAHGRAMAPPQASDETFWTGILSQTYRTELRVEKPHRTRQIFEADAARYAIIRNLAPTVMANSAPWWLRRIEGRLISVLRLIKASFTFSGGPDYLAWKIERHSGFKLALSPFQKRHPVLSAGPVLWRLWRSKTIR